MDGKLLSMLRSKSAEALAAAFVASKAGIAVATRICDVSPRRLFRSVAPPLPLPRRRSAVDASGAGNGCGRVQDTHCTLLSTMCMGRVSPPVPRSVRAVRVTCPLPGPQRDVRSTPDSLVTAPAVCRAVIT